MSHFTPEQIAELEARYGLKPVKKMYPVLDGEVAEDGVCWWRAEDGPERVDLSIESVRKNHLANLLDYPDSYQLKEPRTKISYLD